MKSKNYSLKKEDLLCFSGVAVILLLTISGIIELMPFINSRPTVKYATFPSRISNAIAKNTKSGDVFLTEDANIIQLSGRKVFLGDVLGGGLGLDKNKRQEVTEDIYDSADKESFCNITLNYKIGYVVYDNSERLLPAYLKESSYFSEVDDFDEKIIFLDTKKSCKI